jgi:hypothetical protein
MCLQSLLLLLSILLLTFKSALVVCQRFWPGVPGVAGINTFLATLLLLGVPVIANVPAVAIVLHCWQVTILLLSYLLLLMDNRLSDPWTI